MRGVRGAVWTGCKIKALRAKTNTYIKTPARGDEPVFVITGRREDVSAAKQEILSAAEHFSQIRASRRVATAAAAAAASGNSTSGSARRSPTSGPTAAAVTSGGGGGCGAAGGGQVTCEVRVPVRSVGLVVGPKGSTVKRIQQLTQTYIVTPSRGTEPVFEVVGSPDNVERARREIESRVQQQRGAGGTSARSSVLSSAAVDLTLPPTTASPAAVVGCWSNPAPSSTSSSSLGFPDVIISGDEFRRSPAGFPAAAATLQSDPLVDVWNRGRLRCAGGLRSAEIAVPPRGFAELLSSLGGGSGVGGGGLGGLLNDPSSSSLAYAFDGDEGIGSLSPDPLGFEGGSPWSRTNAGLTAALSAAAAAAESTSASGRRSWIDADLSATSGAGLDVGSGGRLGTVVDWNAAGGTVGAVRYTDSSSESPTDCISLTPPPRSPMACLFGQSA